MDFLQLTDLTNISQTTKIIHIFRQKTTKITSILMASYQLIVVLFSGLHLFCDMKTFLNLPENKSYIIVQLILLKVILVTELSTQKTFS